MEKETNECRNYPIKRYLSAIAAYLSSNLRSRHIISQEFLVKTILESSAPKRQQEYIMFARLKPQVFLFPRRDLFDSYVDYTGRRDTIFLDGQFMDC